MKHLGFESCLTDTNVCMCVSICADGTKYYEYVILYNENCLVISNKAEDILQKEIGQYFELKEESIFPPSLYLGGKIGQVVLENGVKVWAFGSI